MNYIYFLSDYSWIRGVFISSGSKNNKIDNNGRIISVPKEKCATPEEKVCVVWECWKGRNGRGGYRVERTMYEHARIEARSISYSYSGIGRVIENTQLTGLITV